jgi:hypothetical protein
MDSNLKRILYEVDNNIQWINSNMTFEEFTHSTDTPYNLAMLFLSSYERPAEPNQPNRGTQAEYWYTNLGGGGIIIDPNPPPQTNKNKDVVKMLLADTLNGWRW